MPRPMLDAKSSVVAAAGKKAAAPQALLDEREDGLLRKGGRVCSDVSFHSYADSLEDPR